MHGLIRDITLCILFAWMLGLLAHFSRQPLILAYLIAGFCIGPFGAGWVKSQESISVISELGLIFMLFMIGLEIDLKKIVRAGKVILFAAGGQLLGGCVLGVLFFAAIGLQLGNGHFDALYLCVACALSSTVIIVKVLYEKRELDTLPGRITLGVLVLPPYYFAPVSADGCRSFDIARASIWRMRSRVRLKYSPTSSSVRGSPRSSPNRNARI